MDNPRKFNRGRASKVAGGLLALVAATFALAPAASAQDPAQPSSVSIVSTPSGASGPCMDPALALRHEVRNDDDRFVLRITVSAPLCSPLDAAAAIYDMPDNGQAWPQQLRERRDFRLQAAGVTEVVFAKGCGASQFDVITGATPQTISPTGEHHGPLLFPLDVNSSYQYRGPACEDVESTTTTTTEVTTTTVAETSTTTIPETSTTTVPETTTTVDEGEVLGAVANAGSGPQSPTGEQPEVLGISDAQPERLALTGATSVPAVMVGAALLIGGAILLLLRARKATAAG